MDDKEIIADILKRGNSQAYATIMKRYSGLVYSRALGVMKSDYWAKEITQQTFVRAYQRLDSWRGEALGAWLSAIAMHLAISYLDRARRRRTEPLDKGAGAVADPEYSDEHEQRLQRMKKAIDQLPEQDRQIIAMHYFDGLKTDGIAAQLGLSQSNVLVKLHRIREKLRKELQNEDNE
jgi:RNA polymerase sigma-70 factor (ECF subfamily)